MYASREPFGGAGQVRADGSRQQILARMGATPGEIGLDGAKKLWDMLVLVDQYRVLAARQIARRIRIGGATLTGIVESQDSALPLGDDLFACEALAGRAGPAEHHDGLLVEQFVEPNLHPSREDCSPSHRFTALLPTS
jgi:hypothetical protein